MRREKDELEQYFRYAWEDFRSSVTEKVLDSLLSECPFGCWTALDINSDFPIESVINLYALYTQPRVAFQSAII